MSGHRRGPSIRTKVLLVAAVLLTIPWLGYRYVAEMEKFLREGQERTVAGTARAVATALHDRPQLFETGGVPYGAPEGGLPLVALTSGLRLDGQADDWERQLAEPHRKGIGESAPDGSGLVFYALSAELRAGKFGRYLYALVRVSDERAAQGRGREARRSDALLLEIAGSDGEQHRYRVTAGRAGALAAATLLADGGSAPEARIQGAWLATGSGYSVELRLPLAMVGDRVRVLVTGTRPDSQPAEIATLLLPDSEIDLIIKGLARADSRIWVLDRAQRVVAQAGDPRAAPLPAERDEGLWERIQEHGMRPLYALLLPRPKEDFADERGEGGRLEGREIEAALSGIATTRWRRSGDDAATRVSAAQPVWNEDRVVGAVLVEESTNPILTVRNAALESLFNLTLAVFVLGSLALFLFATHISSRIRRLRDAADRAIDPQGRVRESIEPQSSGDEIGDLSRSFAALLNRLGQYTGYLEQMATRLSHEIRTPIAVVRSSLDNLKAQRLPPEATVYVERADQGLARLNTILTSMGEATRLEQALDQTQRERFDLAQVVAGCVEGYRQAYPGTAIRFQAPGMPLPVDGAPDLMAQLLDKLVANAVDFAGAGTPVTVRLDRGDGDALLRVLNEGPPLPSEMQGRLFESMVSIRSRKQDSAAPHLGLGLYIVRLITRFHRGEASAANREDVEGVVVTVRLPLAAGERP